MFFATYLRRELRRRAGQVLLIALGLAVAVGLVITVTAASTGVTNAEARVLHSLYGIDTSIIVTEPATAPPTGSASKPEGTNSLSIGDAGLVNAASVAAISRLKGVAATAGGLTATDVSLSTPRPGGSLPIPMTFGVDGVDLSRLGLGPFGSVKVSAGRSFSTSDADADVAVVDSDYAKANKLHVGSTITIAHIPFRVIGIVNQPQGAGAANVYIPLARAQALAASPEFPNSTGKVNTIYVVAASAADIPAVQKEIARLLPHATVTSSDNLASEVTGSLANAASLIHDLGRWLTIAVLLTAFAIASLLTTAAVARRVREFGTLKALGWQTKRIIAQIMGESAITGLIGAILGIALGLAGTTLINHIAPTLTAQNPIPGRSSTVGVRLAAHVSLSTLAIAIFLAIAGSLIAGTLGGWRAARLRPADALTQLG